MARKVTEKTVAQKATIAAREAYSTAKERHGKQATDQNLKAMQHAKERVNVAEKVENRERFENVIGGRAAKILSTIGTLSNGSNRRSYEYDASDVDAMFGAFTAELSKAKAAYTAALATTGTEKKAAGAPSKFVFKK